MRQILNEELFRIQEIMGIKKTSINEDFQSEQNNLISEQGGEIAALLKGASTAGKFEKTGMSVIDDIVRNETESLSKTSKYVTKTYDSLDELTQAIARKEIAENVAEDIATTIMKKIIVTPDGSKIVAKAWFEDNMASGIRKVAKKIDSGANLPPSLTIKTYKDYELIINKISTGDVDVDTALKAGLEDTYGIPLRKAKTEGEKAIAVAKQLDKDYDTLRSDVISKIKKDPDLSTKKIANWFKFYDDKAKNKLKELGDYDARKFLLENLQKPSFMSKVSGKFGTDSGIAKFLNKLLSIKGLIWTVSTGLIVIAILLFYYGISGASETFDELGKDTYTKIKKVYPVTENASKELLNYFISSAPTEVDNLLTAKPGYSLKYQSIEDSPIGPIEELKIETPSNTYEYTLKKDTGLIDEKITPKGGAPVVPGGGGNGNPAINELETFKTFVKALWGAESKETDTYSVEGDVYIANDGQKRYKFKKEGDTFKQIN
jgi:hypothetical protein